MAYDEGLAERVRDALADEPDLREQKMFGGLAFLVRNHLCCGIVGNDLMVRVGPTAHEAALQRPHTRVMDFTGRPSRGLVYVAPAGLDGDELDGWIARAQAFVATLPPKQRPAATRRRAEPPGRARA